MIELPDILAAKILIVDDQETNISLLLQMLSEEAYTDITTTMNPQDVCQMHRERHFDLILLDLQMHNGVRAGANSGLSSPCSSANSISSTVSKRILGSRATAFKMIFSNQ